MVNPRHQTPQGPFVVIPEFPRYHFLVGSGSQLFAQLLQWRFMSVIPSQSKDDSVVCSIVRSEYWKTPKVFTTAPPPPPPPPPPLWAQTFISPSQKFRSLAFPLYVVIRSGNATCHILITVTSMTSQCSTTLRDQQYWTSCKWDYIPVECIQHHISLMWCWCIGHTSIVTVIYYSHLDMAYLPQ